MTAATLPDTTADDTRRYWVLATVTLATLLFAMTVTISYVVLPQMQGSLSATQDQIAWSVTFNLVATAVGTPASGAAGSRSDGGRGSLHRAVDLYVDGKLSSAATPPCSLDGVGAVIAALRSRVTYY